MASIRRRPRSCTTVARLPVPATGAFGLARHQSTMSTPTLLRLPEVYVDDISRGPTKNPSSVSPNHGDLTYQKYLLLDDHRRNLKHRRHDDRFAPSRGRETASSTCGDAKIAPSCCVVEIRSVKGVALSELVATSVQPRRTCTTDGSTWPGRQRSTAQPDAAVEEAKIFTVNEGIKRALTDLLNCDAVKADATFRSWIQRRLMSAEQELRGVRKRRVK